MKYTREGLAYKLWRMGSMNRAAFSAKTYPAKLEEAVGELFEQKPKAPMPDWLIEDYNKKVNNAVKPDRGFLSSNNHK